MNLVNDAFSLSEIRGDSTGSRSQKLSKRHARRLTLTPTSNMMQPVEIGSSSSSSSSNGGGGRGRVHHGSFSEKEFPRSELPQLFEWSPPPFSKSKDHHTDHHSLHSRSVALMSDGGQQNESHSSSATVVAAPRHGHHTRNRQRGSQTRSHSVDSPHSGKAKSFDHSGRKSTNSEHSDDMNLHSDSSSLGGNGGSIDNGGSLLGRTYLTPHQGRRLRRRQPCEESFPLKASLMSPDFDPTSGALHLLSPNTGSSSLSDFESVARYMDQEVMGSPKPSPMGSPINVRPRHRVSSSGHGQGAQGHQGTHVIGHVIGHGGGLPMSPQSPSWRSPTPSSNGLHALLSAAHDNDRHLSIYGASDDDEDDHTINRKNKSSNQRNRNNNANNNINSNNNNNGNSKLGCLTPSPSFPHSLIEDRDDVSHSVFDSRHSLFSPLTSPALSEMHLTSPGFLSPMEFSNLHTSPGLSDMTRGRGSNNMISNFSSEKDSRSSSSFMVPASTSDNSHSQSNNSQSNNSINNSLSLTSPSVAWSQASIITAPTSIASVGAKPPPSCSQGGASSSSHASSHASLRASSDRRGPVTQSFAMSPPLSLKHDFLNLLADSSPFPIKNMRGTSPPIVKRSSDSASSGSGSGGGESLCMTNKHATMTSMKLPLH